MANEHATNFTSQCPSIKFLGAQPCASVRVWSVAASASQQPSLVDATETIWPARLKIFPVWPLAGVCWPLI